MQDINEVNEVILTNIEVLKALDVTAVNYDLVKGTWRITYKLLTPKRRSYYQTQYSSSVKAGTFEEALTAIKTEMAEQAQKKLIAAKKKLEQGKKDVEQAKQELASREEGIKLLEQMVAEGKVDDAV